MFEIEIVEDGSIRMAGRLDASEAGTASAVLDRVESATTVDLSELTYISSMGLGLLLKTQKRIQQSAGKGLRLTRVNKHLFDVFQFSGFHHVFEIEAD